MTNDRLQHIDELATSAADLDDAGRVAFLDEHCGNDDDLRTAVEAQLDMVSAVTTIDSPKPLGETFDAIEPGMQGEILVPANLKLIGQTIDKFTVVRIIGSGGMGCVYEAQQDTPRRSVALKVMRASIATPTAMRRFELESQLLALLRHRGIAQVYDAGTFDDGDGPVPWFAMEYIPGARDLTEFADEKNLSLRARLQLFVQVCDAVHHGHQKGITHRDLKPGNILVDTSGQPRIIDFGVARSTDSDLSSATLATSVGQLIGTIPYMSPEQCAGDPADIDTRSDVYALGVVLYELVCGRLPYDLSNTSIHEATRIITQEPPVDPRRSGRRLPRDVVTIVLKAMEKDRERRYASAQALSEDIRRYLEHEPIVARPPSITYQARMFCRRHPTVTGVGLVAVLVAAVGVPVMVSVRADADIARARQVAAEALATTQQNRRIEEVNQLVGLVTRVEEDIRHLPDMQAPRRALLNRIIERLSTLADEADRDPLVVEQLAMAWERLANVPLGEPDDATLADRFAAWDQALDLRTELADQLALTGTTYSLGGDALDLAHHADLSPALRLRAARRARAAFVWCRDQGDYTLLARDAAPYRQLLDEEIADCDATIKAVHAAIANPQGRR